MAKNLLTWIAFGILIIGVPLMVLKSLAYDVPTPLAVGNNKFTLASARALALSQSEHKNNGEAAHAFEQYFALGGQEADMMAMYAYTLSELGRKEDAVTWAHKATAKDPNSKAAQMIRKALENQK